MSEGVCSAILAITDLGRPMKLFSTIFSTTLALASPALAGEIWVSNEKDDTISVIDIDTLEVIRTLQTGDRPRGIIFSKDHSVLYICASDSDTVQVMDPDTGKILHNLPSGEDPEQFALHPNNRLLYIACLLYTSPSPRDLSTSRMPSSA